MVRCLAKQSNQHFPHSHPRSLYAWLIQIDNEAWGGLNMADDTNHVILSPPQELWPSILSDDRAITYTPFWTSPNQIGEPPNQVDSRALSKNRDPSSGVSHALVK